MSQLKLVLRILILMLQVILVFYVALVVLLLLLNYAGKEVDTRLVPL